MHSNTVIPLQKQNKISVWHELDFYREKKLLVTPCQFVDCFEFDGFVCETSGVISHLVAYFKLNASFGENTLWQIKSFAKSLNRKIRLKL